MRSSLLPILILVVVGRVGAEIGKEAIWNGLSCVEEESAEVIGSNSSVSCHGIRLLRKMVQKILQRNKSIELVKGISLVEREADDGAEQSSRDGRLFKGYGLLGTLVKWLQARELRISLPSLVSDDLENAIQETLLPTSGDEGRKKEGTGLGSQGGTMLMALMMCKMMAAMAMGALGLLAMKALAASAAALMMSLVAAAKKMSNGKEDEQRVVYATEIKHGHHRRRRSLADYDNYPYRAYMLWPTDAATL